MCLLSLDLPRDTSQVIFNKKAIDQNLWYHILIRKRKSTNLDQFLILEGPFWHECSHPQGQIQFQMQSGYRNFLVLIIFLGYNWKKSNHLSLDPKALVVLIRPYTFPKSFFQKFVFLDWRKNHQRPCPISCEQNPIHHYRQKHPKN